MSPDKEKKNGSVRAYWRAHSKKYYDAHKEELRRRALERYHAKKNKKVEEEDTA